MTPHQFDNETQDPRAPQYDQQGAIPGDMGETGNSGDTGETMEPMVAEDDTGIIEGRPERPVEGPRGQPVRIEVGARVYSSDGVDVAVVEITSTDTIGIRAGSPGRSIVVPSTGIAHVSRDGWRVDLHATAEEVRDLSGAKQQGRMHLAAQQPGTLAREDQPAMNIQQPASQQGSVGGLVGPAGPAEDAARRSDAR